MASPPVTLEYYIGRMGVDPERTKLNKILRDIEARFLALGAGPVNQYVTYAALEEILANLPPSGGSGVVETIVAGYAISVDSTDPANPIVAVVPADLISADADNQLVLGGDGGLYVPDTGVVVPGSVNFTVGAVDGNGPILPTNVTYYKQVGKDTTLSGNWYLLVSPLSSVTVDIRLDNWPTIPDAADSITGGNAPAVAAASSNFGDYTGWTTAILTRGQVIAAVITANTGCRYIDLMLESS